MTDHYRNIYHINPRSQLSFDILGGKDFHKCRIIYGLIVHKLFQYLSGVSCEIQKYQNDKNNLSVYFVVFIGGTDTDIFKHSITLSINPHNIHLGHQMFLIVFAQQFLGTLQPTLIDAICRVITSTTEKPETALFSQYDIFVSV